MRFTYVSSSCTDLPVRLSSGVNTQSYITGIVEVLVNGTWSAVCYNMYNKYTFAQLACRQLGFEYETYGSTFSTWMNASRVNNVYCTGNESTVFHCYHDVIAFGGRCLNNQLFTVACYRSKMCSNDILVIVLLSL